MEDVDGGKEDQSFQNLLKLHEDIQISPKTKNEKSPISQNKATSAAASSKEAYFLNDYIQFPKERDIPILVKKDEKNNKFISANSEIDRKKISLVSDQLVERGTFD